MANKQLINEAINKGEGVLQLIPSWVPRPFNKPGHRLRLHPEDYFSFGVHRGAIVERWFSSITNVITKGGADDEGLSYVNTNGRLSDKVLFRDFLDELGAQIIGDELKNKYGTWPMFAKFYDYQYPLFHHLHQDETAAKSVGLNSKPEHYFFPVQYNNHPGDFPLTYFGFDPSVTKEEVLDCLRNFKNRDTRITELSRAYRLKLGTGWFTPAGVIHAPGSLLTYEPQWNSDVLSVWENIVSGEVMDVDLLTCCLPKGREEDVDYIFSLLDWEKNTCSDYRERYFNPPLAEENQEGYKQDWICYGNEYIAAKELTVYPGQTVIVKDSAAYGCVVVQGYGKFGTYACESANLIRFGAMSADEFFVSEAAAKSGITIKNCAVHEPLVILKHFGPNCGIPQKKI